MQKFVSDWLGEKGRGGKFYNLFWILNSGLKILISIQMSPLWRLFEHPFHENYMCRQGITYNACPQAQGGFYRSFYYLTFELFFLTK